MNLENEFSNLMIDLEKFSQQNGEKIVEKLAEQEQKCYVGSKDDSEKFVSCMSKQSKIMKKKELNFEFQLVFLKTQAEKCIKNSGGEPLTLEECKVRARETLKKSFQYFLEGW